MNSNFKIHGAVEKDFIKVPKTIIRDTSMSSDAKVILEFLIDLTGEFSINERGLSSLLGISLFKVGKAIGELEKAGYISKRMVMNKNRFAGWFWDISVTPIFKSDSTHLNFSDTEISDTNFSDTKISDTDFSDTNFPYLTDQVYIKDRKDTRPTDTRLKEEKTNGDKTEEREFAPILTPLNQSGERIISSGEVNTIQAFNRFCEVYPNVGDRNQAQAAFFNIPDINKICWQIVNSVEWFEKTKRWDDWRTGQKNVVCPQAAKFLKRGDWQQFLKSGNTMSFKERLDALLPDEEEEYETN